MKAKLIALASLFFATGLAAQTPGADLDAKNAAQDAEISAVRQELAAEVTDGHARDAILADLVARIAALEAGVPNSPSDPVDPQPQPTPPPPTPAPTPPTQPGAGENLLGPQQLTYFGVDYLLNTFNQNNRTWPTYASYDKVSNTFTGTGEIGIIRGLAERNPAYVAGDWVVRWKGDCDIRFKSQGAPGVTTKTRANRLENTFDGAQAKFAVLEITRNSGGCSNVEAFRAEHEALIDAGEIWSPWFKRFVSKYYDVIRSMDWNKVNASRLHNASDLPTLATARWGIHAVPYEAQMRLANETGAALWLNLPPRICTTSALEARLQGKGQQARWAELANSWDEVAPCPEAAKFAKAIVDELEAANYPESKLFYLELGNEVWNWGGGLNGFGYATEFFHGLNGGLEAKTGKTFRSNPKRGAYGYFSALVADEFGKALAAAGRTNQQWLMVIGTQTANKQISSAALDGVVEYASATAQPMSRFGLAATGYYRGGFHHIPRGGDMYNSTSSVDFKNKFLADLNADPAALADKIADWHIQNQNAGQSVGWMLGMNSAHEAIAQSYGALYAGQYEGDSHDTLDKQLQANPQAVKFHRDWHAGPEHARVIKHRLTEWRSRFPNAVSANYQHYCRGLGDAKSPWCDATPWGSPKEAEIELNNQLQQ